MEALWDTFQTNVRFVNLVRHPYCWLHFFVHWRCTNMGMAEGVTGPIDHEWNVLRHDLLEQLDIKPYRKEDVEIWASYQGMLILNRMVSDLRPNVINYCLERVVKEPDHFQEIVDYLTYGRVCYNTDLLNHVYSWIYTPFRLGGPKKRVTPKDEYAQWPAWKKDAFKTIVVDETRAMFDQYGYQL